MVDDCGPFCHFGDRLYFTTFPDPVPVPAQLNSKGASFRPPRHRFLNHDGVINDEATYYYFQVESELVYLSFFKDWGPLNLAMVYKACILIHELLEDQELKPYKLVLYSGDDPRKRANSALLMALYVMIVQKKAPWEAFHPIAEVEFMPFRDAGRGRSDFNLSIQDCLWGMWKAMQNGLLDMNEFNVEDYEFYEKVENGDWNWITPSFIAFASPVEHNWNRKTDQAPARKLMVSFQNCLDYFEKNGVKLVVRLNNMLYDKQHFLDRGIRHEEMYFDDGTNPTDDIVRRFINMADEVVEAGGAIAIHCKAGLGRTGTLIGAYLIWKYGFTAHEAIAFMRIVRPGSVVGPQQQYMYVKQTEWMKWSAVDELRRLETQAAAAVAAAAVVTPATPPAEVDEEEIMDAGTVETMTATVIVAPTTPKASIPPVTPSKATSTAAARAGAISPPGQPRKTPLGKRTSSAALVGDSDESDASSDELDSLPQLMTRPRARTQLSAQGAGRGRIVQPASEARPTRVTRASAAAAARGRTRTPPPISSMKGMGTSAGAGVGRPSPNKIPRLATRTAPSPPPMPTRAATAMGTRSTRMNGAGGGAAGGGAAPSRLPTLIVNTRRVNAAAAAKMGSGKEGSESERNAWMRNNTSAVVKPGTKSERPGLRSVRRRRSSFSAADVVA